MLVNQCCTKNACIDMHYSPCSSFLVVGFLTWVLAFVCGTSEELKKLLKLYASQKSLSYRKYSVEKYQHWQFAYYIKNSKAGGPNKCSCKTWTLYIPFLPKLIQD